VSAEAEAARIRAEYERRARDVPADFYALFHRANLFAHQTRERELRELFEQLKLLPLEGRSLLEVGCGEGEWFASFERFGLDIRKLAGIDLEAGRIELARRRAPGADVRRGDAAQLPWPDASFDVVFQSTVLSSVLDRDVRHQIAREMLRMLRPGGTVVSYDFAWDNPKNKNVSGVRRKDLEALFPGCALIVRRVTLAPPLARWLVPHSWLAAELLQRLGPLNTHLLAAVRAC
jgi:ubiquinone/menaquinone biosynthesis C-methylase UbiE